ncbi:unnamed protein product [Vitrella brassicaformis CCMP3155]|uniref:Uncharacterized protein n=1 Tax=Vitrella brassicaformis (strain CCMP3155) TaxID=1169540 RepID=A0A0G4G998_VITBC|nr:unnamed protein product [Vitrella brassicaformis CCMP3155]|eukprot:CEM25149.1 unnamed protein product [Vitrella brassicaformis CCMP3155]
MCKEFTTQRFLGIWRYFFGPNETIRTRLRAFFQDMLPLWIVCLYNIHGPTTVSMVQLVACMKINDEYRLQSATSVRCYDSQDFFIWFGVGIVGLVIWSIGIPMFAMYSLYLRREVMYDKKVREQFAFLYNGYTPKRWYWEGVILVRKVLVLLVGALSFEGVEEIQISFNLILAIGFLYLQFNTMPFDKRSWNVLNKMELRSLAAWCLSSLLLQIVIVFNVNIVLNTVIGTLILLNNVEFNVRFLACLFTEVCKAIRNDPMLVAMPVVGPLFRPFVNYANRLHAREPRVLF